MKLLGIDYGDAKVGLALGDTDSKIASPFLIIKNSGWDNLCQEIKRICQKEWIEKVVIGVPIDHENHHLAQTQRTREFIAKLSETLELDIEAIDESYSTQAAKRLAPKGNEDDVAAMLILQSYLDNLI